MLNNEFRLLGTIVSDWEKVGSDTFPKYEIKLEVEKRKKGQTSVYTLVAYEKNYVIDVTKSLKGKLVFVSGYLDLYKDFLKLVLQDLVEIGAACEEEIIKAYPVEPILTDIEDAKEEITLENDDLPF